MKIAIVNQPFDEILPPVQNSIGIWSYEAGRRLSDRHEVTVYGPYTDAVKQRGEGRTVLDHGVVFRFAVPAPGRLWSRIGRVWDRAFGPRRPIYASWMYFLDYCLQVAVQIRRSRPDVVHVHNFTGFVPVIRVLNPRVRLVLHMNGEWLSQLDARRMASRIAKVDAVFGSSDHITRLVQRRFPQYADRCHTVYNGVDPEAFSVNRDRADSAAPNRPTLVFVGRVSPEKGVHDLLDAMSEVITRCPGARLEIIGPVGALPRSYIIDISDDELVAGLARFYDRDYGETLHERVENGLAGHVEFLGSMSHDDVVRHIANAALLVNPSYSESFGMSLVEALACERPVVATRVGGMPEIVDADAGILVEPDDSRALAAAITRLLSDAELRREMGAAGRRRVENVFAWSRVAAAAEQRYAALLLAPRKGRGLRAAADS